MKVGNGKPVKIGRRELTQVMDHAARELAQMPARAKLPGMIRAMTEGERHALALMNATAYVLGSLGFDTGGVYVSLEVEDSDVATEF